MATIEGGICPNINRRGSSNTSNPEGDMVRADNGELLNIWTLEWRDEEHAYDWYNAYSISIGFSIRRNSGYKNKDKGYYTSRTFVCSKEGLRKKVELHVPVIKERRNTRCGCLASFTIQRQSNGKYCTFDWCAQHNHELATPSKAHLLRSHRQINELQRLECDEADRAGIRPKLAHDLMVAQAGGREKLGFTQTDLKNYLSSKRGKSVEVGVASALLNWFGDQYKKNSQFFFKIMFDDDEQITNVFWSDHDMRNDYALFGNFVSFDTTYRTNNEHRPLGAFLGVNHHRERVVFGACLLFDETAQSFKWLFENFVKCMGGKAPQSLFTDQDAAMLAAIPSVLPDTHHFLCVWHIQQNALKNLGLLFRDKDFKKKWDKLLFDADVDDFELEWSKMIDDHELHDNDWLRKIYEKREKWAPMYVRSIFCAGKRTTQLSESFNATLRKYLKTVLNMPRFFDHFQQAVDDMRYKELRSNFEMDDKLPILKFTDPLCVHASKVYTPSVLTIFLEQFEKASWIVLNCRMENVDSEKVEVHICSHNPDHNCSMAKRHIITTINGFHQCSCNYFNYMGIICSHILWLLKQKSALFIPEEYILSRWTRKARLSVDPGSLSKVHVNDPKLERVVNRRRLMNMYASIISQYGDVPELWEVFQCYHTALVDEVAKLMCTREPCEVEVAADRAISDGALEVGAKGWKTREPKHRGNKRLKSVLEGKKRLKHRGSRKCGSVTLSQPVARHLILEDKLEVSSEDELLSQLGKYKSLENL